MPAGVNYKQTINNILIPEVSDHNRQNELRNGTIDPRLKLFFDLGITSDHIQALAPEFNDAIRQNGKWPPQYVTSDDLGNQITLDDLYKLLAPSFEGAT